MSFKGHVHPQPPFCDRERHIPQVDDYAVSQHLPVEDLAKGVLHAAWNAPPLHEHNQRESKQAAKSP